MGADNRRIDKEVACLGRGVRLEPLPKLAPEPTPFPAAKAVVHRIPVSKLLGQVTPRRPGTGEVKNGFNEHPIAEHRRTPSTGFEGGEDGGNLHPRLISQQQTYSHEVSSSMYRISGIEKTYPGILNSSTRPRKRVDHGPRGWYAARLAAF